MFILTILACTCCETHNSLDYMRYLLVHDSVHGKFPGEVTVGENKLVIDGR
jgi:glyceraldehyde-3-phosphate dehydrogenase/erythrose-4-phosphate dehydrogenase